MNQITIEEETKPIYVLAELLRYVLEVTLDMDSIVAILPHMFEQSASGELTAALVVHVNDGLDQTEILKIENRVRCCMKTLGATTVQVSALDGDGIVNYLNIYGPYNQSSQEYCWPLHRENWNLAARDTKFLTSMLSVLEDVGCRDKVTRQKMSPNDDKTTMSPNDDTKDDSDQ